MPASEIESLLGRITSGERHALAKGITIVENSLDGVQELLRSLSQIAEPRLVGITGPPGAGKSTLVNSLLGIWTNAGLQVAVIAVDPSSPFHYGSLLGDRIRMARFYNHPQVYIRSLASRGAMGGLHPRIFEITDLVKEAGFDIIVLETVGVGQSEVEIAGIADCTVVTLVPEGGDIIQTMKAGLLEIADIFVVNKSDREGAEAMYGNLRTMAHEQVVGTRETPVLKTNANTGEGVTELAQAILKSLKEADTNPVKKQHLQLQKALHLIREARMSDIFHSALSDALVRNSKEPGFNIYKFAQEVALNGLPL